MSKNAVFYMTKGPHIQLLAVSIASLVDHYQSEHPLPIYVYMENPSERDCQHLQSIPELYGKNHVTVHLVDPPEVRHRLKEFDMFWPNMVMWKLFIPLEYPEFDKILYLDNDTIVQTDVTELFERIEEDALVAAVPDFYFYVQSDVHNYGASFGIEDTKRYFNVGVVLFNVANYVSAFTEDDIVERINNCQYQFPEQTILNIMCEGRTTLLPLSYNYQKNDYWLFTWARYTSPSAALDIVEAREKIGIRHFVGYQEYSAPWEHLGIVEESEYLFWHYLNQVKMYLYDRFNKNRYDYR